MEIKTKINKRDLIELKSLCTAKETINKVKRQPSEQEKTIANEITDKGLLSKIYKQLIQVNIRKTNKSLYECPIVSASFVKKGYFSSIELLLYLVKNQLNIVILVYFSTLRPFVLLIFHGAPPVAQVSVSQILVNTCKPFFNYSYCGHHHYYHHHYN